jgi:hypothetical protein
MIFLSLLAIPILIAIGFFILTKKLIIWQEFLGHLGVAALVAGISTGLMYCSNVRDVEVWGGHVTDKKRVEVSCEHDYCCMTCQSCSTDSKGNTTCHDYCCMTCYDHKYDVDWRYTTTDAGTRNISRVDRQGVKEPSRWTKVSVGEPSASSHNFVNYIKASPDSLFNRQGLIEKFKDVLPAYPGNVYDYYRINRLVTVGTSVPDPARWNMLLMQQNDLLGAAKQVSLAVVIVKDQPRDYFHALAQHWLGGKKNDFITVISVDGQSIQWVEALAWSQNKLAEVSVRDSVLALETIEDPQVVVGTIGREVGKNFLRKPMKDFEYLKSSITPTTTQWVIATIINILISIGLGVFFHQNDITEGFGSRRRRWR